MRDGSRSPNINARESLPFHASQLSTPLDDGKPKRRRTQSEETPSKKPRMMAVQSSNDVDAEMEEVAPVKRRCCRRTAFRILDLASSGHPSVPHRVLRK